MSPSSREREREYAKRRYEKWAVKHEERVAARRRARRNAVVAIAAVVAVIAVIAVVAVVARNPAAEPTTTAGGPSSPTPSAATDPKSPCRTPPKAPSRPKSFAKAPDPATAAGRTWKLAVETSCGPMAITLDGAKAPAAVANAIVLAREGYFDDTPCHRLTTSGIFVLQCGDPTGTGTGGPGYTFGPVENAPKDDVYPAGTVAMARQGNKGDSMGSQFFLVYKDSTIPRDAAGGYTVLGRIVGGLDTLEKVAAGGASAADASGTTAPKRPVSILSTTVTPG